MQFNPRIHVMRGGIAALAMTLTVPSLAQQASSNIKDYVAAKLDDFTAIMRVQQHDDNALRKISKDFGMIYKIKGDIQLRYKEENRMRIDGALGASKATLIVAGEKQIVRIPSLGLSTTDNLGESPGKRKTLLDVGLLSEGYLSYTQAVFKGVRPVVGIQCAVFEISYTDKKLDTSHRIVWIDPKTKVVLKREEYSQEGKLNAVFVYKDPKEIAPGVWFPSAIEVTNNQGQKAGTTEYSNVKVNTGLEDSVFK
jgi:outer membrane lipoprotein-sorting protein